MVAAETTPLDIVREALRPGLAGGILENRSRRVIDRLQSAGFVVEYADTVRIAEQERAHLLAVLKAAKQLCDVALPCFDWGKSPLTPEAIRLLNEVPTVIDVAIAAAEAQD